MSTTTDKLIKQIEELSVLELTELVKALEDKFGVTASAPAVVSASAGSGTDTASDEAPEEQSSFTVLLKDGGTNKIAVIKALRELNPNLGLKEAKDLSEKPGAVIAENVNKGAAEEAKTKLTVAGAAVELK
ncbi:MAG: 50S ribosomal protein L7/L12 [Candidatus Amesbacteria bacterium GW2011_GWB1_47_19]|nr:MAG: 50S ribosomal protein L7/L12 [Candidatus Amesbacteria bacterium GW2011_GWA1_44_24]KKU31507.1 MAG: 50S ribosomal protein L7/L12 [Candidatus Amesbacteria bacterium GW2011_GWC1_46_24]KKU67515.1 MAG: 50S ribosomal protein L7/L12 [Candidatus Amesbacteria bacterium GW2011_GWB1_47_19]OGD05164.1 MAG: 50S ribosomal protein L7/L12 [Candidatus Amesbacteria bacterium RIFOXYB1_FULL_47_13]HBC72527.1 50S ribosomal protein L7/L12 [Candidatus Amesbacteria bacterium]